VPHLAAGELAIAVGPKREETKGIYVKDLKVLGSGVQKDSSLFYSLVQQLVKSIKNHRKIQK
jgi:hypothetical protein